MESRLGNTGLENSLKIICQLIGKSIYKRLEGYQNTALLWTNVSNEILPEQFEFTHNKELEIHENDFSKTRLGNFVEGLFFSDLNTIDSIDVLSKNIQVNNENRTLGEIDCILKENNKITHIEIVYKFYLFQNNSSENEVLNWVGPNLNDNLQFKLNKLKEKQFPLLYQSETIDFLPENVKGKISEIHQKTHFKAQLFHPYQKNVEFELLNPKAIAGFYIQFNELSQLKENQFYIPEKLDWLIAPQESVKWLNFDNFKEEVNYWIQKEKSPLCWMKSNENVLKKLFVVWW